MLTNEQSDEIVSDERIKSKYVQICGQLNIDETIMNTTWDKYRSIRNDHTLEVTYRNLQDLLLRRKFIDFFVI